MLDAIIDNGAKAEKIVMGFEFTEGPVFSRLGYLLFSDVRASKIYRYALEPGNPGPGGGTLTIFRENSNESNGLTFDHQGRLLACERAVPRITRTEKDGQITVLADRYQESPLNSPNDLVYSIDGSVYFSDPPRRGATGAAAVYQITRDGEVRLATSEPVRPNGVALGPKQLTFYVADSAERTIWSYDVAGDGSLLNGRVLAELKSNQEGSPDGVKTDEAGNIYVAGPGGIWVFTRAGEHLGTIATPERPSNCCWGSSFRGLYITARTSVYYLPTKIPGTRTF